MKRINILFLTCSLNVGGTENHIFNLISNLDKKKFNPVVCCLYALGEIGEMLLNNNEDIKVYHHLMRNKLDITGIWKLMHVLRNKKIHILYIVNSPLTLFLGVICAKFSRVSAYITRMSTTNATFHAKRQKVVNYLMSSFIDKVIAQAYSHKEYLISHDGFRPEKIEVIYNGVKLESFMVPVRSQNLKQKLGIPDDAPVIGIVARLAPEKGHSIFLKAAIEIINVFPNAHFLIVGDGEEKKKLEKITHKIAIQSNVLFLGARRDIPQLLSLFDVAVLVSNPVVETFSNAILEYMAASLPVVATKVGSLAELVVDGETGYLIPYGDSNVLAGSILNLLKDKSLAKKMGEASRERIIEKFTLESMIAKYESLFADLVN